MANLGLNAFDLRSAEFTFALPATKARIELARVFGEKVGATAHLRPQTGVLAGAILLPKDVKVCRYLSDFHVDLVEREKGPIAVCHLILGRVPKGEPPIEIAALHEKGSTTESLGKWLARFAKGTKVVATASVRLRLKDAGRYPSLVGAPPLISEQGLLEPMGAEYRRSASSEGEGVTSFRWRRVSGRIQISLSHWFHEEWTDEPWMQEKHRLSSILGELL